MNKKMTRIAVYGTLKQGWGNHGLLQRNPVYTGFVNIDRITGVGFPKVKLGNKEKLYVEIYDVDDKDLLNVDRLEGYSPTRIPTFYDRVKTEVTNLDNGEKEEVFIYEIVENIPQMDIRDICEETCTGQGSIYTWLGHAMSRRK